MKEISRKLLEIIDYYLSNSTSELKGNIFYLSGKGITVSELSSKLNRSVGDIISFFWNEDEVVTRNKFINYHLLNKYLSSIGLSLEVKKSFSYNSVIERYIVELNSLIPEKKMIQRSPIISVMGHVDHGKTTLFDTISKSNLQKKESGGITQKISVSRVEIFNKNFTFLDTPGHSDFIKMRKNGISLLDVVILVINLEEGAKEQTIEVINYIKKYNLPFLVFVNIKRDFDNYQIEKMLENLSIQLQIMEFLSSEDFIEKNVVIVGDAKSKESVDNLLKKISLFDFFEGDISKPCNGIVIDSYWNSRSNSKVFDLFLKDGVLNINDVIFIEGKMLKIKSLDNFHGEKIYKANPGDFIKITGLNFDSELGSKFISLEDDEELFNELKKRYFIIKERRASSFYVTKIKKNINVLLLSDSKNSLEAFKNIIDKKNDEHQDIFISIVNGEGSVIGDEINNHLLNLAKMTESTIIFFFSNKKIPKYAFVIEKDFKIIFSNVIYDLENKLEKIISDFNKNESGLKEKVMIGEAAVRKSFFSSKSGYIAGCRLISGKVIRSRNIVVDLIRKEKKIFSNHIKSLESEGQKINKIEGVGKEFGIIIDSFSMEGGYLEGDKLLFFTLN